MGPECIPGSTGDKAGVHPSNWIDELFKPIYVYAGGCTALSDIQKVRCESISAGVTAEDALKKLERRNSEDSVSAARSRYLQRKQERQMSKAS